METYLNKPTMKTETEPKQTAMQRLIDRLEQDKIILSNLDLHSTDTRISEIDRIIKQAESLLPEERKVIEEAYEKGLHEVHGESDSIMSGEQYFTTKFKQ